jgi:hypothetical protein
MHGTTTTKNIEHLEHGESLKSRTQEWLYSPRDVDLLFAQVSSFSPLVGWIVGSDVCARCMGDRIGGQNRRFENDVELKQQFTILTCLSTSFHAHGSWTCSLVMLPKLKESVKCLYMPYCLEFTTHFFSRFSELKIRARLNFEALFVML